MPPALRFADLIACWGQPCGGPDDAAGSWHPSQPLGPICTDSRQLAAGQLFVPLVGERFDGHHFLPEAAAIAAQAALVQRDHSQAVPPGLLHGLVDDTLAA